MKAKAITVVLTAIISAGFASTGFAHHSLSGEFDRNHRITLTGTVKQVDWENPHVFFYVDVRDANTGEVAQWACELGSPNMLTSLGWNHSTLKAGMTVHLTGVLAKNGTRKVIAENIVADGNKIVAWPHEQAR